MDSYTIETMMVGVRVILPLLLLVCLRMIMPKGTTQGHTLFLQGSEFQ